MPDKKSDQPHKYWWSWQTILRSSYGLLLMIPFTIIFIYVSIQFIHSLLLNQETYVAGIVLSIFVSPFSILFIFSIVYVMFRPLFSNLQISENGLKYRKGLMYGLTCQWEDVESLGHYQGLATTHDVLYLKRIKPLKWSIFMTLQQRKTNVRYFVPLTGFQGWPEGGLADDLHKYASHLFVTKAG